MLDMIASIPPIPAMTSPAERECYARLTKEAIGKGAILEFGTWLGASTIEMARAIQGTGQKIHTYDKFQAGAGHVRKVDQFHAKHGIDEPGLTPGNAEPYFRRNMGPLIDHCVVHNGQIEDATWDFEPIALIVNDAPKRVPAISAVLTNFRAGIRDGTVMAWQDFCHFPSYEIPACLYRLREHFEFTEAVVPGSTMVFRTKSVWAKSEVTREALALKSWTPKEIAAAWRYWDDFIPAEKFNLFMCGQAMFLADIGCTKEAAAVFGAVLAANDPAVRKKWEYLRGARPDFLTRYHSLFACL